MITCQLLQIFIECVHFYSEPSLETMASSSGVDIRIENNDTDAKDDGEPTQSTSVSIDTRPRVSQL